jgi:hypothetical protein
MTAPARRSTPAHTPAEPPRAAAPDAPFAPAWFRDRGVVLAAITPAFAFARVRDAAGGRELVLRNASGSRGAIVMPLAKAADYARPTLHDRAVLADLAATPRLGPGQMALIARTAARAGLAGRSAMAAAEVAAAREARAGRASLERLLQALGADEAALPRRDAAAIAAAAARLGLAPADLLPALARLAPVNAAAMRLAALPPRLRQLATTAEDAATVPGATPGATPGTIAAEEAGFVAQAAAATAALADAALAPLLAACEAAEEAILANAADPDAPALHLDRAAWLLDGWPALLARWDEAEGHGEADEARAWRALAAAIPPAPAEAATTEAMRAAVRGTWRRLNTDTAGANDQALLERLRVAAP